MLEWKIKNHYIFWECVSSLRYLACKAHAPFRHLWPVWIYYIFRCIRKIAKSEYSALIYLSFRLSIRLEQLGFHRADFHEIWYWSTFRKPVDIFRVSLKVRRITGNIYKDQYIFSIIPRSIILGIKKKCFRKRCKENQDTFYVQSLFF